MHHFRLAWLLLLLPLGGCNGNSDIEALGTVERDRVELRATAAQTVVELPVAQGTEVAAETILVRLDDRQQQAVVGAAEAELQQANAALDELRHGARIEDIEAARARVEQADAELVDARQAYDRLESLLSQGLGSVAARDAAQARFANARAGVAVLGHELDVLLHGTRMELVEQAAARRDAAAARLELERLRLAELAIAAPRAGRLDALPVQLGDRLRAGDLVAVMLAGPAPFVRAYIPISRRSAMQVGDRVSVLVEGRESPLEGQVRWLSADPAYTPFFALTEKDRARLVYLAEIQLPDGARDLPVGLPARVLLP